MDKNPEDNVFFIPEKLINKQNSFLNIININNEKGNFKFNCINLDVKYCKKDIENILDIFELKNCLFCFNLINNSLDKISYPYKYEHIFFNINYSCKSMLYINLYWEKISKGDKFELKEFNEKCKNIFFFSELEISKAFESKYFYIILMERMSLFYEEIINNSKITMDFSLCKSLLSFLFERRDNYIDFKEWN